ncbi:GDSL esterase/lipase At5g14450-like [Apium graveolens]|uniref:GDSL esterase/lipase At5g14450-like n=1 Tax=Apium graveolens TaxID=4045 RepID=UPI003D7A2A48
MDWIRRISSTTRYRRQVIAFGVVVVATFLIFISMNGQRSRKRLDLDQTQSSGCQFPAFYNFGDSNSDTGAVSATFGRLSLPNGQTFFRKPAGRYCDGRLVIDFIAEKLGLPYLSAYLDSIGTNFRHGANFAASGSTIQPADSEILKGHVNPLSLNVQLLQFEQFKGRTAELYTEAKNSHIKDGLPRPEDFSNALYTMDTGQNDLHAGITSMREEEVEKYIPNIINEFSLAIKNLHQLGARTFWIHNTGPIGCLPFFVVNYPPKAGNSDQNGCVKSYNDLAQEFNKQLKDRIIELRTQLNNVFITYVDIYSVKYSLISEARKHDFSSPLGYCCGHYGDYRARCGRKSLVNGTKLYGTSCRKPEEYLSWDGIHYSEAANKLVADHILDGSFSDPPIAIREACHKPF